jgi:hypothetical protein
MGAVLSSLRLVQRKVPALTRQCFDDWINYDMGLLSALSSNVSRELR